MDSCNTGLLGVMFIGSGNRGAVNRRGRGEVKNRESPESKTEVCIFSHAAEVGRFLGMVMYDNELKTKENCI